MVSIRRGIYYLFHNRSHFCDSIVKNYLSWLPDRLYLSLRFRCQMGYWIDWKNPKTFSEKIQWLKIYNRKPEYTMMVDKYAVKQYVADSIGEKYIIPTLGVWENFDDIDFSTLPRQFVLKTTHGGGGGGVVICRDKSSFDKVQAKNFIKRSMKGDIYKSLREWPYKKVPKRIIAEKFMTSEKDSMSADLSDYKFFCFNGEPKYCQVIRDRHSKETIDFYDKNWNHQEFVGLNPVSRDDFTFVAHNGVTPVVCPKNLEEMMGICRILAKGISFLRVDLYVIDEKIYFGELTFYPASGFGAFSPKDWNSRFGELITSPNVIGK